MAIEQISVGDNFSYVIYCPTTKKAVLVDPGYDPDKAMDFIEKNDLKLEHIINTHHHGDHTAGNSSVQNKCSCDIIASSLDKNHAARGVSKFVNDGEELQLGKVTLRFIQTPGHTFDGLCIIVDDSAIITGDTLFINDCGRCDLAGGSLQQMFNSLQSKIKILPDDFIVYPGHNYGPKPFDTLGNQKKINKTLIVNSLEEFRKIP
jgi:glyoxylase-like metal-dependent hydrolase (beta-lactamase superfamily II)